MATFAATGRFDAGGQATSDSDDVFGNLTGCGRRTMRNQCGTSGVTCNAATFMAGVIDGAAATKSASVWPGRTLTVKLTGGPRST